MVADPDHPTPAQSTGAPLPLTYVQTASLFAFAHYFTNATRFYTTGHNRAVRQANIQSRTDTLIGAGSGAAQKLLEILPKEPVDNFSIPPEQATDFADALSALTKASAAVTQIQFAGTLDKKHTDPHSAVFRQTAGFSGWNMLNKGIRAGAELFFEHFPQHADASLIGGLPGIAQQLVDNTHSHEDIDGAHQCPASVWESFTKSAQTAADSLLAGRKFAYDETARKQRRPTGLSYI